VSPRGEAVPPTRPLTEMVRTLIDLMGSGGITALDLSFGDVSIRLRGGGTPAIAPSTPLDPAPVLYEESETDGADEHVITAPMIGTFYSGPSPGDPPFVRIGDVIETGQIVGIIEAMKIMNEIPADRSGIVRDILVASGQAVEYGSPLVRVAPTDASP
jgi:acetyl-CoA carboxylase biotin carboxyl carrier protein